METDYTKIKLGIIMSSFGREELLEDTLTSLYDTSEENDNNIIVIIDNGFEAEGQLARDVLSFHSDEIDFIALLNCNAGKPHALNLGMLITNNLRMVKNNPDPRKVKINEIAKRPDFYLFCDNDIKFLPGWRETFIRTYLALEKIPISLDDRDKEARLKFGALSGFLFVPAGRKIKVTPEGELIGEEKDKDNPKKSKPIIIDSTGTKIRDFDETKKWYGGVFTRFPPGCCMLIRREIFEEIGAFDQKRLIKTVDTSWYTEAWRKGYRSASIFPESVILHMGKGERSWDLKTASPKLME